MSIPVPQPDAEPEPDGLPPLPAELEERLYAILFDSAGAERETLLAELIAGNRPHAAALRRRAEAMSVGDAAMTRAHEPLAEAPLPPQIGNYRILALLGEGGFGAVYRAEQHEPVRREVALKVLHARRTDARSEWRFLAERQTLARMLHANIAQIYDAGTTDDGRHFFAMELVDGVPITTACDRRALTIEQRLRLFLRVAAAMQHAHQRGVVHRDLKPGNVLVRDDAGDPEPKVIDFGVAKLLEDETAIDATIDGALIGTPAYMSPEQAAGQPVDTRTDVYSLGVLLYELLTGDLPFPREQLAGGATHAAQVVREQDPRRLTTALHAAGAASEAIARRRSCSYGELARRLTGDLEWIVRRALAKNPEHRYATVAELATDVERHLDLQPVAARQHEALYVWQRFVARHRVGVVVSLLLLLATLGVIVVLGKLLGQVDSARRIAVERGDTAIRNEYAAHLAAARAALDSSDIPDAQAHLAAAAPEHRGWEWNYLHSFCDASTHRWALAAGDQNFGGAAWLDDERACIASYDGTVTIWQPRTGAAEPAPIRLPWFKRWCWSADRSRMFAILDNHTHVAAVDIATWKVTTLYRSASPLPAMGPLLRALLPDPDRGDIDVGAIARAAQPPAADGRLDLRSLALSPDERTVAVSDNTGALLLLPVSGRGRPRLLGRAPSFAWDMKFTADGERLVVALGAGRAQVWDLATGTTVADAALDTWGAFALALDDAHSILYAAAGRHLFRLDLATLQVLQRVRVANEIECLRYEPAAAVLFGGSGAGSGVVLAWDGQLLEEIGRFHGQPSQVHSLDFDRGGDTFLSCSRGAAMVYDHTPRPSARQLAMGFDAHDLAVAPDGEAFAAVTSRGWLRLWNARTLQPELAVRVRAMPPDGRRYERLFACALTADAVYVAGDRLLAIDRATHEVRRAQTAPGALGRVAVDPDARWLLAGCQDRKRLFGYRLPALEPIGTLELDDAGAIAFDLDRGTFVVGNDIGTMHWIDLHDDGMHVVDRRAGDAAALASVPGLLAIGGDGISLRVGADGDFDPLRRPVDVSALAITPDRQRIAFGADNRRLRMLDRTGREVLVLDESPRPLTRLAFAAGGTRLVGLGRVSGGDCYVMVWGADVR